jgi:hypothetical protein
MGGHIAIYGFGGGGVNLVKDPLELDDSEATQLQNAELIPDEAKGGEGSLSKRGGLAALTSALAGSVLGIVAMPLQTTYVRTLYVAFGDAATGTRKWKYSTDGSAFSDSTGPLLHATDEKFKTFSSGVGALEYCQRRPVSWRNTIFYNGDDYTQGSANPPIAAWDGTNAYTLTSIPAGPNSTTGAAPAVISDMVVANGVIYLAVIDPAYSGTLKGRVLKLDPRTGILSQVANPFGSGTGEQTGGAPIALCWFNGQLWVAQHNGNDGSSSGSVCRCYPAADSTWTQDTASLDGFPQSLIVFKGNLYACMQGNKGTAGVAKRTTSSGAWASVDTFASTADGVASAPFVLSDTLYYVRYDNAASHKCLIRKSTDGSAWTTDLDIESAYTKTAGTDWFEPVHALQLGSDVFVSFRSSDQDNTDGQLLKLSGGSWSRALSDQNIQGGMAILVTRS